MKDYIVLKHKLRNVRLVIDSFEAVLCRYSNVNGAMMFRISGAASETGDLVRTIQLRLRDFRVVEA